MDKENIRALISSARQILGVVEDQLPYNDSFEGNFREILNSVCSSLWGLWNLAKQLDSNEGFSGDND